MSGDSELTSVTSISESSLGSGSHIPTATEVGGAKRTTLSSKPLLYLCSKTSSPIENLAGDNLRTYIFQSFPMCLANFIPLALFWFVSISPRRLRWRGYKLWLRRYVEAVPPLSSTG